MKIAYFNIYAFYTCIRYLLKKIHFIGAWATNKLHSDLCNVHVAVVTIGSLLSSPNNWMRPFCGQLRNRFVTFCVFVKYLQREHWVVTKDNDYICVLRLPKYNKYFIWLLVESQFYIKVLLSYYILQGNNIKVLVQPICTADNEISMSTPTESDTIDNSDQIHTMEYEDDVLETPDNVYEALRDYDIIWEADEIFTRLRGMWRCRSLEINLKLLLMFREWEQ